MSDNLELNRRRFIGISGSILLTGLAGCSGDGGDSDPDNGESATPTATGGSSTPAETAGTQNATEVSESLRVIDSLSDYRTVANNPEEWVGREIGASDVSYYQPYEEEYQGFRMVFEEENTARPFMLKTDQEFRDGETISFSGTVEKTGEIQTAKIIYVENVTIE